MAKNCTRVVAAFPARSARRAACSCSNGAITCSSSTAADAAADHHQAAFRSTQYGVRRPFADCVQQSLQPLGRGAGEDGHPAAPVGAWVGAGMLGGVTVDHGRLQS